MVASIVGQRSARSGHRVAVSRLADEWGIEVAGAVPVARRQGLDMLGGVAAQGSQAVTSLALQVLAARLLGVDGLGRFGALYAVIILATALCSGFIGDSLTVLDRSRAEIRAGLQMWLLIVPAMAGALSGAGAFATGLVTLPGAIALGGATAAFLVEDSLRRLLMATMHFWRIVLVDVAALVGSVSVVVGAGLATSLTVSHFLVALMVGQVVATFASVAVLPASERYVVGMRPAALAAVAAYGGWRAVQQAVRPALLASVRIVGLLVVSAAAVGRLEAARIYMAPAMLVVAGVSSFLFASYASRSDAPLSELVHLADGIVLKLLGAIGAFCVVAVTLMGWLGTLLTGDKYELSLVMVGGWAAYAASVAAVMPYGQLAAVRGRQAAALAWRVADSIVSLFAVILLVRTQRSVVWVPFVLAAGSVLGGAALRCFVLGSERDEYAP